MRLLYTVQRYGEEVGGGAEAACRMLAEQMAARGHRVEVLTSCAVDYATWADHFPPGRSEINGVGVHRLPVAGPRRPEVFDPASARVLGGSAALAVERDWVRLQGPELVGLEPWLSQNAGRFDAAAFYTYLYSPSAQGLPVAARRTATVLHPAAHDEPMIALRSFDREFHQADAMAAHTPEEAATLGRRVRGVPTSVVGLGIEVNPPPADATRFRERYGLGGSPILLYVGRIEPGKGTDELVRYFLHSKQRLHHEVKLVMVGPPVDPPEPHPDVITTGFVDDQTRLDAYAACNWFVLPSYFESFSIALCDAWVAPDAVSEQVVRSVLAGQARRSGAALGYRDYAEFEQSLLRLVTDPELTARMGEAGRRYVLENYEWSEVLGRYERLVHTAIERRRLRCERAFNRLGGAARR